MKAWLETRWRLLAGFGFAASFMALNHRSPSLRGMVIGLGTLVTIVSMMLAGTGVKSQAPVGFPEGLTGSTQFTISLPVSRLRLLAVRAIVGLLEAMAIELVVACALWTIFPSIRSTILPGDFAKLILVAIVFMLPAYCAVIFFTTFTDEPLSGVYAGWTLTLSLWLLHRAGPAVDVIRAWGQESPLVTHTLPWSQIATAAGLGILFFSAAVCTVQGREY
jgi:hypothetical protein